MFLTPNIFTVKLQNPSTFAKLTTKIFHFVHLQVSGKKDFFAQMVVDAVSVLDPATLDLRMIGTKKVQGGGLRDSFLVDGVAFKKTFSYAGFEMQPKSYKDPKILLLNIELELKSEKENAEVIA